MRVVFSKRRVVTQLMDTSGPHGHMVQEYLARCDAVCYMYDVTSSRSVHAHAHNSLVHNLRLTSCGVAGSLSCQLVRVD